MRFNLLKFFLLFIVTTNLPVTTAEACSRLLWNTHEKVVLSGRTFDWYHSLDSLLYINPRGMKMDGGVAERPITWVSKYGSVTSAISTYLMEQGDFSWEDGTIDGINEKGLAAHALYLQDSIFVTDDEGLPVINTLRWVRYILDNFASVNEAIEGMQHVHLIPGMLDGAPLNFHFALEDNSGNSAIIEFVNGIKTVKRGKEYTVLTNNPPFTEQVKALKNYKTFGGNQDIAGNVSSSDRFVRLNYYSKFLPTTTSATIAQSHLLSVMRTVASPFGAPYSSGHSYPTWWISILDLTNLNYYFTSVESHNLIKVDLKTVNFDKNSGVRWLNPRDQKLSGTVNSEFQSLSKLRSKKDDSIKAK